ADGVGPQRLEAGEALGAMAALPAQLDAVADHGLRIEKRGFALRRVPHADEAVDLALLAPLEGTRPGHEAQLDFVAGAAQRRHRELGHRAALVQRLAVVRRVFGG